MYLNEMIKKKHEFEHKINIEEISLALLGELTHEIRYNLTDFRSSIA